MHVQTVALTSLKRVAPPPQSHSEDVAGQSNYNYNTSGNSPAASPIDTCEGNTTTMPLL